MLCFVFLERNTCILSTWFSQICCSVLANLSCRTDYRQSQPHCSLCFFFSLLLWYFLLLWYSQSKHKLHWWLSLMELHLWFNCCNKIPARTQQQICKTKDFSSKTLVLLEETKLWSECDLGIVEQIDLFSMTCKTSAKNHQQLVLSDKRVCFSPSTPHRQLFSNFVFPFFQEHGWVTNGNMWLLNSERITLF